MLRTKVTNSSNGTSNMDRAVYDTRSCSTTATIAGLDASAVIMPPAWKALGEFDSATISAYLRAKRGLMGGKESAKRSR